MRGNKAAPVFRQGLAVVVSIRLGQPEAHDLGDVLNEPGVLDIVEDAWPAACIGLPAARRRRLDARVRHRHDEPRGGPLEHVLRDSEARGGLEDAQISTVLV